jgi:hypothetical protein
MLARCCFVAFVTVCCAAWVGAAPQNAPDREAYAREHIQFLVLQLNQWPDEFTHQFDLALMQPPVDARKLSEAAKASSGESAQNMKRLAALSTAQDLTTNAEFRNQLETTLASAKHLNQALASQRFPARLQSDWDQIRSTLNNLARVYKIEMLPVLEPPAGGNGRSTTIAAKLPPGAVSGYIVDQSCAKKGKGMWANAECVARCMRDGDKAVLVTEDGKVFQISNVDKIEPESYGQKVVITGKTDGDIVTIESLQL